MKSGKIALLSALSLLMISLPMISMDRPIKAMKNAGKTVMNGLTTWTEPVRDMITGIRHTGNIQAQLTIPNDPFPFGKLPKDIQRNIILYLGLYGATTSLDQAAQLIGNLAQTNHFLNDLINDPSVCLSIIKSLAQRFDCSDFDVSAALSTKQAKNQHYIQKKLLDFCSNVYNNHDIPQNLAEQLKGLIKQGVDINFTYNKGQDSALLIAIYDRPKLAMIMIHQPGIDLERANKYGDTPLKAAEKSPEQNKELIAALKKAMEHE